MAKIFSVCGKPILVDDSDFAELSKSRWYVSLGYAVRGTKAEHTKNGGTTERMHRIILGLAAGGKDPRMVDHINGDRLDNRRENLRICSNAENGRNRGAQRNNSSGLKGVMWHPQSRKWRARLHADGRSFSLGLHETPELAHQAYAEACKRLHGEFAKAG